MDSQKSLYILAFLEYLVASVYGFAGNTPLATGYAAFRGCHHQLAHNGTMLFMIAFALPYSGLSPMMKTITALLAAIAGIDNPLAYAIMAAYGESNELLKDNNGSELQKMPMGASSPVTAALLMSCVTIIPALIILITGIAMCGEAPTSGAKEKDE